MRVCIIFFPFFFSNLLLGVSNSFSFFFLPILSARMLASATSLASTARSHGAVLPRRTGTGTVTASAGARAAGSRCFAVRVPLASSSAVLRRRISSRSSCVPPLRAVGDSAEGSEPEKIIDSLKLVRWECRESGMEWEREEERKRGSSSRERKLSRLTCRARQRKEKRRRKKLKPHPSTPSIHFFQKTNNDNNNNNNSTGPRHPADGHRPAALLPPQDGAPPLPRRGRRRALPHLGREGGEGEGPPGASSSRG